MNKRGQIYLVAALVIVGVLAGLTVVYNKATAPDEDSYTFDLSDEIDFESRIVAETGVISGNTNKIGERIEDLTDNYALNNPNTDFLIIYYDSATSKFKKVFYDSSARGKVSVSLSGEITVDQLTKTIKDVDDYLDADENGNINFEIDDVQYSIPVGDEQNFYVIVKREREREVFVGRTEETEPFACNDGEDNDEDGKADSADPGCYLNFEYEPSKDDESNPDTICQDLKALCLDSCTDNDCSTEAKAACRSAFDACQASNCEDLPTNCESFNMDSCTDSCSTYTCISDLESC